MRMSECCTFLFFAFYSELPINFPLQSLQSQWKDAGHRLAVFIWTHQHFVPYAVRGSILFSNWNEGRHRSSNC